MNRSIILILFSLIPLIVFSQNGPCPPASFCDYVSNTSFDIVVFGKITDVDSLKARIQVSEILWGEETRDTITIWSNTDTIFAQGSPDQEFFSRSTSDIGKRNEFVVIVLNKIKVLQNEWDIMNDYRIPTQIYNTPWLKVKDEIVWGNIYVDDPCFPKNKIEKMSFNKFKTYWTDGNFNCDILVSNETVKKDRATIQWIDHSIIINHENSHDFETEVYNSSGKLLFAEKSNCECMIDLNSLEKGILIIKANNHSGNILTKKILNR